MPSEMLRLAEAAKRLGLSTHDIVQMVHNRTIDYVLVDGVARIPDTVVEELRQRQAS